MFFVGWKIFGFIIYKGVVVFSDIVDFVCVLVRGGVYSWGSVFFRFICLNFIWFVVIYFV